MNESKYRVLSLIIISVTLFPLTNWVQAQNSGYNYVHTRTVLTDSVTSRTILNALADSLIMEDITYFDGLGRPMQVVNMHASPEGRDIRQVITYDEYGREAVQYLPYVSTTNSGDYDDSWGSNLSAFYSGSGIGGTTVASDTEPWGYKVFDGSPLNRVVKEYGAGESWHSASAGFLQGHYTGYTQSCNNTNDSVTIWSIIDEIPEMDGYYEAARLYKAEVSDEDGHVSQEFTDFQGKTILKRSWDGEKWLETYYVYDDFGLLRFVIPPMAVALNLKESEMFDSNSELLTADTTMSAYPEASFYRASDVHVMLTTGFEFEAGVDGDQFFILPFGSALDELCYSYKYDTLGRMIEKKLPGADPVYMVYDSRNRLVATQDGNQRSGDATGEEDTWLFTKYDVLNRPYATGYFVYDGERDSLQQHLDASILDNAYLFGDSRMAGTYNYSNLTFPTSSTCTEGTLNYLTTTYYDSYPGDRDSSFYVNNLSDPQYFGENEAIWNTKGLVTLTKTRVLGTESWEYLSSYYDYKGRVLVQYLENDYLDGTDITQFEYGFTGDIKKSNHTQTLGDSTRTEWTIFEYDPSLRPVATWHKIGETPDYPDCISTSAYNEAGQLITKKLGVNETQSLQTVDYLYNIRGWMTNMNKPSNLGNDLFAMQLYYNTNILWDPVTTTDQYNGNLSAIRWRNVANENQLAYGFTYDELNRLIQADYEKKTGAISWTDDTAFDVDSISYDANGNILFLRRYNQNSATMDELEYSYMYYGTSNQLRAVSDNASAAGGFEDGASLLTEYRYDPNGNMIIDQNKGITLGIQYNYLNLPEYLAIDTIAVEYIYDAAGTKLMNSTQIGDSLSETIYFGNFVYENGSLKYILSPEGRINYTNGNYDYEYWMKDHLGNIRLTFSDLNGDDTIQVENEVSQINDYYPFGLKQQDSTYINDGTQRYLYNGKELQKGTEWLDYGARMYDAALGRFHVIDRFAEKYASMTPYQYGANNPISFIDINGDSLWIAFGENNKNRVLYQDGKLLNADGSLYTGEGVRITKKGKQRITDSFLSSVTTELGYISNFEAKNGTNVISTLQGSDNNFTIAKGLNRFDPGTFEQPYLYQDQATYHMTNESGCTLSPFWSSGGFSYSPLPADKAGSGGIIYWSGTSSKGVALGHEMFHGYDANTGHLIIDPTMDARTSINNTNIGEIRATTYENNIRSYYNIPLRETYNKGGHKLIDSKGNPIAMPPAKILVP
ncbi:MAG: RHS repeat-associated core domain-containing protein [Bacteroidales bacterium]|nr:RHS repeat-associated core domain-containing protein [Bacteroidales bacterium]